jgi:hypothetical protein
MSTKTDTTEITHRFIEALNARDAETLAELVTDGAEFRPREGKTLTGQDGIAKLVQAAADLDVRLVELGEDTATPKEDVVWVVVPVDVAIRGAEVPGTAEFELRDGKVAAFDVVTTV